jgi:antirestriction protein ArdC
MARKFTPKSAEERAADADRLHAVLSDQIATLTTSDGWRAYLAAAKRFHAYSFNNFMLIVAQKPDATRVAGYRTWQSLGRQVRKGEAGIRIYGFAKRPAEANAPEGSAEAKERIYFPVVSVFDISQTDPIEGAEVPEVEQARELEGDDDGILEILEARLLAEGFTIEHRSTLSDALAYVDSSWRIVVSPNLSPRMSAAALLHEAAHAYLGHVANGTHGHRGLGEVEAESTAYVAAGLLGIDTSQWTVGYVAGWAQGDETIVRRTAERVIKCAASLHALIVDGTPPERLEFTPTEEVIQIAA